MKARLVISYASVAAVIAIAVYVFTPPKTKCFHVHSTDGGTVLTYCGPDVVCNQAVKAPNGGMGIACYADPDAR